MPQQVATVVENNFTKGLITESTGLNFPENAATDCDNVTFTLIGDVYRRFGIDLEENYSVTRLSRISAANTYKWNNAGGDGVTQLVVVQTGNTLVFYKSSAASVSAPLSTQVLASLVNLSTFTPPGGVFNPDLECQFSDGNGYLFVYHPSCDPIYCSYSSNTVTANKITVKIRDFIGVPDNLDYNTRPSSLTTEHNYNLINQGWVAGNPWEGASSSVVTVGLGSKVFNTATGLSVTLGTQVTIVVNHPSLGLPAGPIMTGNVTAYNTGTGDMTINVTSGATGWFGRVGNDWGIVPYDTGYISSWFTAVGNYPSNSDVWWYFKNTSGAFAPSTTVSNVSIGSGKGPRGHFILDAFSQQRNVISGLSITNISTFVRPKTGTWFQGRVWYTGVDAQQAPTGDAEAYTWTENIYFSQVVFTPSDFGKCYQVNDPTSEKLFDLLPTDGGVIQIQGCGSIYKLFPIQNGLLVFAGNGVWFITGSQGIGFTATDYTITKISSIQSISSTSFVNVQGLPYFWNEEGIYSVQAAQNGSLQVEPITVGTILSFYNSIPVSSKKYVRGDYHPIDYVIQWTYRSTEASNVIERYRFDKILNYNTFNKAFYPYTVSAASVWITGILYVSGPGGSNTPEPTFKYLTTFGDSSSITWSDERDDHYIDFSSIVPTNYLSYFVTGYKIRGQGIKKFQPQYIQVYSRLNGLQSGYRIQGLWNYSNSRNSGKWSSVQTIHMPVTLFDVVFRRHRIRGSGFALQFKVTSLEGVPFDIIGWAVVDSVNQST